MNRNIAPSGFSLLEMSVVLLIISTLVAGGMSITIASVEKKQEEVTRKRLEAIDNALQNMALSLDRLPCPADPSIKSDSLLFLMPDASRGTCNSGFMYGGTPFVKGDVPVRGLGLSDDYALDGWGRRFSYYVKVLQTAHPSGFSSLSPSTSTTMRGRSTNTVAMASTRVVYALVSHGKNGHGATTFRSTTPLNASSTNSMELSNCSCSSSGTFNSFTSDIYTGPAVTNNATPTLSFDDITIFRTRADILFSTE